MEHRLSVPPLQNEIYNNLIFNQILHKCFILKQLFRLKEGRREGNFLLVLRGSGESDEGVMHCVSDQGFPESQFSPGKCQKPRLH